MSEAEIVGVFTLPPKPRQYNSDWADVGQVARDHDLMLFEMRKVSDEETEDQILALKPDVIFVFGLSQLIKPRVLEAPRLGCIGSHPTLLPKNRGRHPLIWPVVRGETQSGLSFFFHGRGRGRWRSALAARFSDPRGRRRHDALRARQGFSPQSAR